MQGANKSLKKPLLLTTILLFSKCVSLPSSTQSFPFPYQSLNSVLPFQSNVKRHSTPKGRSLMSPSEWLFDTQNATQACDPPPAIMALVVLLCRTNLGNLPLWLLPEHELPYPRGFDSTRTEASLIPSLPHLASIAWNMGDNIVELDEHKKQ